MTHPDDRHSRQRRLPEVGERGQARVAAVQATVAANAPGALVELAYLERAGVERLTLARDVSTLPFRHADWFQHRGPAMVAAGAWRALDQLRHSLELPPTQVR